MLKVFATDPEDLERLDYHEQQDSYSCCTSNLTCTLYNVEHESLPEQSWPRVTSQARFADVPEKYPGAKRSNLT